MEWIRGRIVVVTGASSGIGAVAARRLAELGATVVPVGRSPEKTAAVARSIGVEPLTADFTRLEDVRRLAATLSERCPHIDVLINNAGGVFPRRVTTGDGHELTFQVNHLAPFLLTALLRDRLRGPTAGRVVTTSSKANTFGRVHLDDLDTGRGSYRAMQVYATTKLENILFTRELARREAVRAAVGDPAGGVGTGTGAPAGDLVGNVTASCCHPGVVATGFARDSVVPGALYRLPLLRRLLRSAEDGAAPLVALATAEDPDRANGRYFDRFVIDGATARQAADPQLAARLWERSAELVGVDP